VGREHTAAVAVPAANTHALGCATDSYLHSPTLHVDVCITDLCAIAVH